MTGVLLDPIRVVRERGGIVLGSDGRPAFDRTAHKPRRWEVIHEFENARFQEDLAVAALPPEAFTCDPDRTPPHVLESLKRAEQLGAFGPRGAIGWQETVKRHDSDGVQVLNTATETIMVPDHTLAADFCYGGRQLKYVLWGRVSTVVTTPGTIIFSMRWGGIGGVVLVVSKAQRPKTTTSTNMAAQVEMVAHFRDAGTVGAAISMGMNALANTIGDATAAGELVWPDAPAEVAVDTTTAKALSPTIKFSVATATTAWTTHIARIEALT